MDLLVVGEPDDPVASAIVSFALSRGRRAILLNHDQAARLFTLSNGPDGAQVEPDVPMVLRPRAPPPAKATADETFLRGEAWATLWAAAALATSPVLNRPGAFGAEGRWSVSGAIIDRRAHAPGGAELHLAARGGAKPPDSRPWAIEATGRPARRWRGPVTGALGRARPILEDERYERVIVLDDKAWRSSTVDLAALTLETRSIAAAAQLGLAFAAVTWGVGTDHAVARLARIDPYPSLEQLWPVWSDVAPALMSRLGC